MDHIANVVAKVAPDIVVPRPVLDLTTKRVLVMTFLPGTTLLDGCQLLAFARTERSASTLCKLHTNLHVHFCCLCSDEACQSSG